MHPVVRENLERVVRHTRAAVRVGDHHAEVRLADHRRRSGDEPRAIHAEASRQSAAGDGERERRRARARRQLLRVGVRLICRRQCRRADQNRRAGNGDRVALAAAARAIRVRRSDGEHMTSRNRRRARDEAAVVLFTPTNLAAVRAVVPATKCSRSFRRFTSLNRLFLMLSLHNTSSRYLGQPLT